MENSPENRRPLVVAGDWQGDLGWAIMVIRCAARERADTVLHVGDFGLDWPGAKRDRFEARLNKYMFDFGITRILSGGNHDNWETLGRLPVDADGLATFRSNIRVLPRAGRTETSGLMVGALGRAFSIDCWYRTAGKDWWSNEEPTPEDARRLIAGGPVDVLISHDAPLGVPLIGDFDLAQELIDREDRTRALLRGVVESLAPPHVFYGHWPRRKIHELVHADGRASRVDVLNNEGSREGNAVLVWPREAPLLIEPFLIRGQLGSPHTSYAASSQSHRPV